MARKLREKSVTGIYHVMLRGINKQNIFFCDDDFMKMQYIIHDAQYGKDERGKYSVPGVCAIYAYCILNNHLHILIREGRDEISTIMKRIEDRYAMYYNLKYERVGHLFQGRFPSEPVNDADYFHRLLRYIHRNSVKAMEAVTPEEYPFSSWNEYIGHKSNIVKVLDEKNIATVLKRFPLNELTEWVNMNEDDDCLDMDNFKFVISDNDAFEILADISGIENPEDFRFLDHDTQIFYLLQAIQDGISIRQAARLGTVTDYQIRRAINNKNSKSNIGISDLSLSQIQSELHDKIRAITGLNKLTRSRMHMIVEYLTSHPSAKRQEIANHLEYNIESTRKLLVKLINENIITQEGSARSSTYMLYT